MNINKRKFSVLLIASSLVVSPIVFTTGSGVAGAAENNGQTEQTKVKYLSNQDLFDELEKNGYDLEDIFTKQEIEKYKAEDQLRAGKTQVVDNGDGTTTLYLSSAYTKTIAGLGAGASTVIGGLLGGVVGGGFGAFLGQIAVSNINTDKGIYIKFKTQKNTAGQYVSVGDSWGYQ